MPGLIDPNCQYFPSESTIEAIRSDQGTVHPEFSAVPAARNVQKMLLSGMTSLSILEGSWFIETSEWGTRSRPVFSKGPEFTAPLKTSERKKASQTASRPGSRPESR
jgi:hypothetical protein